MKKRAIIQFLIDVVTGSGAYSLKVQFNHSGDEKQGTVTNYNPTLDEFTVRRNPSNDQDEEIFFVKSKDILSLEVDG